MIDRNIEDKNMKKELLEMINMEKRKTALEYLIEQENKKSAAKIKELENLETDNNQLKTDNKHLKTNNEQLNETLHQIKNYYAEKVDIPKEIIEILFKI